MHRKPTGLILLPSLILSTYALIKRECLMNLYEVKYHDKQAWEEISEIEILESLLEVFDRVTPAIQEMIQGKRVLTPKAMYRIKDRP